MQTLITIMIMALTATSPAFARKALHHHSERAVAPAQAFTPLPRRHPGTAAGYPGTFMKGGRFPNHVAITTIKGNQVLQRVGPSRGPIKNVRSGLYIPKEMVSGQSEQAFYRTIETDLAPRLDHEFTRIFGG